MENIGEKVWKGKKWRMEFYINNKQIQNTSSYKKNIDKLKRDIYAN